MEITLKRNYGFELVFKAENIKITEEIEERIYPKDENGKSIINLNPKRDIKTEAVQQFVRVLEDLIHFREAEFDSSSLIEELFDKLPKNVASDLSIKLEREYNLINQ